MALMHLWAYGSVSKGENPLIVPLKGGKTLHPKQRGITMSR